MIMDTQKAKIEACEAIATLFWTFASHEDGNISHYRSAFYAGAKDLLVAAIKDTYPDVDAEKVYDIMSESSESVAECVSYWRHGQAGHEWCQTRPIDYRIHQLTDPWFCDNHQTYFESKG
jgi:hypothetical protein